jgi:hypothetical protein
MSMSASKKETSFFMGRRRTHDAWPRDADGNPLIVNPVGQSRKWVKLWVDPWLKGTVRFTLDHVERAVFADLLALGGQSRISGVICAGIESGSRPGLLQPDRLPNENIEV